MADTAIIVRNAGRIDGVLVIAPDPKETDHVLFTIHSDVPVFQPDGGKIFMIPAGTRRVIPLDAMLRAAITGKRLKYNITDTVAPRKVLFEAPKCEDVPRGTAPAAEGPVFTFRIVDKGCVSA